MNFRALLDKSNEKAIASCTEDYPLKKKKRGFSSNLIWFETNIHPENIFTIDGNRI